MKRIISFAFVLLCLGVKAQNVGINGTGAAPDASAMLDVVATNKGVLVPRVALTATNAAGPVTSPTTSLLVYNTATAGTAPNNVTPGYYYWSGSAWTRLSISTKSKYTIPMWPIGMTIGPTGVNKAVFWNQYGTTNTVAVFTAADPAIAGNVALGATWLSQGWNVITSNGLFEGATGWIYSSTANVSCTIYIYKYTPNPGVVGLVTPVLLGTASTGNMANANTVYSWTATGGGAVSKGDIIWVFYKVGNAATYYGYGALEFSSFNQ